jgi:chitinase
MIGQNDFADEVFTKSDAEGLNNFARSVNLGRLSMWSANRDVQCSDNYADPTIVSDSCGGIKQNKFDFAIALSKGLDGDIDKQILSKDMKTDERTKQKPDDPATSPYQIWNESNTYLAGTKVVWHQNVYQAKWWTKGDVPDNPVLQSWETPWQLIGPVLPGETPIPQPMLPPWTYPTWSGKEIYNQGERVLFQGVPYEAKWWTEGDSPAASTSNPDSSPWRPLSEKEIEEILGNK